MGIFSQMKNDEVVARAQSAFGGSKKTKSTGNSAEDLFVENSFNKEYGVRVFTHKESGKQYFLMPSGSELPASAGNDAILDDYGRQYMPIEWAGQLKKMQQAVQESLLSKQGGTVLTK